MKNIYFIIYCILIFLLSACASAEEKNMSELADVAREINEKCPAKIDSETRLDGISVKEPNTLVYNFSLIHVDAENVDTVQFYRALWPGIISNVKVSIEMKKLRDANTNIEYIYHDKTGKSIYTFHIKPADYLE